MRYVIILLMISSFIYAQNESNTTEQSDIVEQYKKMLEILIIETNKKIDNLEESLKKQDKKWEQKLKEQQNIWEEKLKKLEEELHIQQQKYPSFTYLDEKEYSYKEQKFTVEEYRHKQTGMEFIAIPKRNFLMAKTEITQGIWQKIMNTTPWRGKKDVKEGEKFPATYITWNEASKFCQKTGLALPTEKQWEYAYRSGSDDTYYWGNSMNNDYAWYNKNTYDINNKYAHEVAQKKPNAFGLHDMSGNIWEWCADRYDNSNYIFRGGSWRNKAEECSSVSRSSDSPTNATSHIGFRPVYNFIK